MSWEAWITLALVVGAIVSMVRELMPPAVAVLSATTILYLLDVIDSSQAFAGFSNDAPLTIAALYILAGAVSKSGLVQPLVTATLGTGESVQRGLRRLLPPVVAASSVMNNTPIVAVLVPEIEMWAARRGLSVSRYLMPLSFASILGGIVTLMGTSTNLVVSGLLDDATGQGLGFFEVTKVGLPIAVLGLGMLIVLSPRLLHDRRSMRDDLQVSAREFVVDMVITVGGPLDGVTVGDAGLRHLTGVFLVEVVRDRSSIAPVAPDFRLDGSDELRFVGRADDVVDLHALPGLESREQNQFAGFDLGRSSFFEVVVGASSPLVGRTLKQATFRSTYQGAVVAIHRAGHRINAKLGEVALRVGDTLIVLSDQNFRERWRDRQDFLLISAMTEVSTPALHLRVPVAIIATVVILLAATSVLSVVKASLLGALAVIGLRILTPAEARRTIDLDVLLLLAGGIGLASAITESGLATLLADGLVTMFGPFGDVGVLIAIVLATVLLTEAVSNAAAAVLMFPIAIQAASTVGLNLTGVAVAIAISASASFLTPIGYQTNVMVYGPGGYRFSDYIRLGFPLTILMIVGAVAGVAFWW